VLTPHITLAINYSTGDQRLIHHGYTELTYIVQICKGRRLNLQCSYVDIIPVAFKPTDKWRDRRRDIQGFVINAYSEVTIVDQLVQRQERVVRLEPQSVTKFMNNTA